MSNWFETKRGPVQSFGAVKHTFLDEHSGEMFCQQIQASVPLLREAIQKAEQE